METQGRSIESAKYNAVREDIIKVDKKIERAQDRIENTNKRLDGVPRKLEDMEYQYQDCSTDVERLREKQRIHALKLAALEKEVTYVKTSNDLILDHIRGSGNQAAGHTTGNADRGGYTTDRSGDANSYGRPEAGRYGERSPREPSPPARREASEAGDERSTLNTAERKEAEDEARRERLKKIYGVHDRTDINPHKWEEPRKHRKYPWIDHKVHASSGGLVLLRYDDSAHEEVKCVLRSPQQSIHRHAGGYNIGAARKEQICVFMEAPAQRSAWNVARQQKYRDCVVTENAMAAFWFTNLQAAAQMFENSHRNPLREACWPTSHEYSACYLPLNFAPPASSSSYRCFLVFELLNARAYTSEDLTQFETDLSSELSHEAPGCLPLVAASMNGNVIFKGNLINHGSKVYVSRFESQKDVDRIWNKKLIQRVQDRRRITCPSNAFSFTIEDML